MFCPNCGAQLPDNSFVCSSCGASVDPIPQPNTPPQGAYQQPYYPPQGTYQQPVYPAYSAAQKTARDDGMAIAIKVLLILSCIAGASACLVPLAWCLPMTISIWKSLDNHEPISDAMKICTLIFVNLVAGILLLCDDESKMR